MTKKPHREYLPLVLSAYLAAPVAMGYGVALLLAYEAKVANKESMQVIADALVQNRLTVTGRLTHTHAPFSQSHEPQHSFDLSSYVGNQEKLNAKLSGDRQTLEPKLLANTEGEYFIEISIPKTNIPGTNIAGCRRRIPLADAAKILEGKSDHDIMKDAENNAAKILRFCGYSNAEVEKVKGNLFNATTVGAEKTGPYSVVSDGVVMPQRAAAQNTPKLG